MRPVNKPAKHAAVTVDGHPHTVTDTYKPYGNAQPVLEASIGRYCSYCEECSGNLEVEHMIPKHEDRKLEFAWDNFLLACRRCNGTDNKSNQPVQANLKADNIYFPHLHNTLLIFEYKAGGFVGLHPNLTPHQKAKAENLLKLVKLDKYPGNPKYTAAKHPRYGFPLNDNRWRIRRETWETAQQKLAEYRAGKFTPENLADYAAQRGFFSIWFTAFASCPKVRKALVEAFAGTALNCFDPQTFEPVPRNPTHTADPI